MVPKQLISPTVNNNSIRESLFIMPGMSKHVSNGCKAQHRYSVCVVRIPIKRSFVTLYSPTLLYYDHSAVTSIIHVSTYFSRSIIVIKIIRN